MNVFGFLEQESWAIFLIHLWIWIHGKFIFLYTLRSRAKILPLKFVFTIETNIGGYFIYEKPFLQRMRITHSSCCFVGFIVSQHNWRKSFGIWTSIEQCVEDTFMKFCLKFLVKVFLNYIICQQSSHKVERNGCSLFLDVKVVKYDYKRVSGLFLNFFACLSIKHKIVAPNEWKNNLM